MIARLIPYFTLSADAFQQDTCRLPPGNGGSGQSALGRIAALANAGLRKNDHISFVLLIAG